MCVCMCIYIYILSSPFPRFPFPRRTRVLPSSPHLPFLLELPPGFVQLGLHLADGWEAPKSMGKPWENDDPHKKTRDSMGFLLIYDKVGEHNSNFKKFIKTKL